MEQSRNIKLVVAYDGTAYLGWQKTPTGPSIEAALQAVLEQILQEPIQLQAASRTDAGVHARGQVVNFITNKIRSSLNRLHISLNGLLPPDIAILSVDEETPTFHPTLDCIGKEYRYTISYGPTQLPQHRLYAWHYPHQLDRTAMAEAAAILQGEHDYSAFCNVKKNETYEDYIREVKSITMMELPEEQLQVIVQGNHFLYKMVRTLVGTLVYVGRGLISVDDVRTILEGQDRTKAGVTAPAHGLCLFRVKYNKPLA